MNLWRLRIQVRRLLELDPCRIESADDHQVPAQHFVRLGIVHVQLKRSGKGLDRFADLLLTEQTVSERIPAPRRIRPFPHVTRQQRLHLFELAFSDVVSDGFHLMGVILAGSSRETLERFLRGIDRIELERLL